jgi:hypothetical protein
VTGAAYRGGAALLEGLIGANLIAKVVPLAFFGDQLIAELIVETLGGEVAFRLCDPFLKAHVRCDDEFAHSGTFYHKLGKDADSDHQTAGRERSAALRSLRRIGDVAEARAAGGILRTARPDAFRCRVDARF